MQVREFNYCSTWGVHANRPTGQCQGKMVTLGAATGGGRPSFPSRTWEKIPEGSRVSLFRAGTLMGVPAHRRPSV